MSRAYRIERISAERLKDLVPLYADVFGKKTVPEYFRKKFDTKSFGAEYIGFIAYAENGDPAAYYGLFPCRVLYEGNSLLSATSGDTMTHSAHRGKGLFVELAQRTYELARQSGIIFAYGFPNQDSLKGSVKLGWQYRGDHLRFYSLKVSTLPLARIKKKLGWEGKVSGQVSGAFPNSLGDHCVEHNSDYFRYKSYSGKKIIEISGSKVWAKTDGVLKIGDMVPGQGFSMKIFLDGLKKYCWRRGITEAQFMTSKGTWLDAGLAKHLSGMDAFPVGHFDFNAKDLDLTRMKYGLCDLDTF